jgi:beta-xylosidase
MKPDGTGITGDPVMVFDGHDDNPTVEGPKFYKRNGWYYIFAPAGGVTYGWQLALRSRSVFGPYEARKVMHQGGTTVNGPHQGAWVTTRTGEDWFIHFQDKGPYGRIVHIQPMKWVDDWPVIGNDEDGDGTGEPVISFVSPFGGRAVQPDIIMNSEEFQEAALPLDWQWHANPSPAWGYPSAAYGLFRLNCITRPESMVNLWEVPNLLLRKLPAESFTAMASVKFTMRADGEEAGLVVMGRDYSYISIRREEGRLLLRVVKCTGADSGAPEVEILSEEVQTGVLFLRLTVDPGAKCRFSYSFDEKEYREAGEPFVAKQGMWIGAKMGFFALRDGVTNDAGYIDLNSFTITIKDDL